MFADSDGLLVFRNVNLGFFAVDFDFDDLGWTESFVDVFGGVVAPVDDVDFFFVADFVHDGLDADASATNKGPDWVDSRDSGHDGDFGAATSFSSDAMDFDGAVFDFGDFLAE